MHYLKAIYCVVLIFFLGCASAMEWQYRHPALQEGAPHALINEEELSANYITSSIKGFVTEPSSQGLESIQKPVMKEYSTGKATAKVLYSISPWGLMTAPFADFTGKTIAVPPGRIGIVIHHVYHKELSRETVIVFKLGDSYDFTAAKSEMIPIAEVSNDIQIVTYEHYEWDDIMWVDIKAGLTYTLYLSKNTLVGPQKERVSVLTNGHVTLPSDIQIQKKRTIVTATKHQYLGEDIEFKADGSCVIKDKEGNVNVTIKQRDKK
jgi:hypothetical protein